MSFRQKLSKAVRWLLHLHYSVETEGLELIRSGGVHLLLPNHPAYVEPALLFSECWDVTLRPMCDEYLFRKPVIGWAVRLTNAIMVPDLPATDASHRAQSAEKARALTDTALQALNDGCDLVFYPSGHIKLTEKEQIGNRRLAYEVCGRLPEGVRIIMVRTTGLENSITSRLKTRPCLRRHVKIHCEDMTTELTKWAQTLEKRDFNEKLEQWYNTSEG